MKRKISKAGIIACVAAGAVLTAGTVALAVYLKKKNSCSEPEIEEYETEKLYVPETKLSFSSFDGGGPEYSVSIDDEGIIAYDIRRKYHKPDHAMMCGSGYDVIFSFRGIMPGRTMMTISARSPIAENYDDKYSVTVSDSLEVTIEKLPDEIEAVRPSAVLVIETDENVIFADLDNNEAVKELLEKLSPEAAEITLSVDSDGQITGKLPWELPADESDITLHPGDIILCGDNEIKIVCDQSEGSATGIGNIGNVSVDEFKEIIGEEKTVRLMLEWSE